MPSQPPTEKSEKATLDDVALGDMDDNEINELMSQIPENKALDEEKIGEHEGDGAGVGGGTIENSPQTSQTRTVFESVAFFNSVKSTEVKQSLRELGFAEFRAGQETVVQRILRGEYH